jgi:hypothetical protein
MLSRRIASRAVGVTSASPMLAQKRHDHDRWYGHALELDIWNYKHTGEKPLWMRPDAKTTEEQETQKKLLPPFEFGSTYECLLYDADRLNVKINRKEFSNEIKYRLEKCANTVARSQQLIKAGTYANDQKVEDSMIARIADEEHVQAEMKYVKCIRANEVAEDNRLDILPGGSPKSLREKTRWNSALELHPIDRGEIMSRLVAWLPEKYHVVYMDDFQTVAANDASMRKEMTSIIDKVEKEHSTEAQNLKYEQDLKEVVAELSDDVDPARSVTLESIKASKSLEELEDMSRLVHEYNGDSRMLAIYDRAAELTKNEEHKAMLKQLKTWIGSSHPKKNAQ